MAAPSAAPQTDLPSIVREWGRIGCLGFGGPPAHIAMLRSLCVERRGWLTAGEFEDALAACNLLPGPASTQLAIHCAWRVHGPAGAVVGGLSFILPGLLAIVLLSALFLAGAPPRWIRGAGAGAGAAVPAVAAAAAASLVPASWRRREGPGAFWLAAFAAGLAAALLFGAELALVLLGAGLAGLVLHTRSAVAFVPFAAKGAVGGSLAVTALKVGALSFGGGFVIIPLMQADAVDLHHWMTHAQFLSAVALGQVTPGPVVVTVAAVGYAAAGVGGALFAAALAFAPSFVFVLAGSGRLARLLGDESVRAFLSGAGPAAIGAIAGAAITLTGAFGHSWQVAVLALAGLSLAARRSIALTLVGAGLIGGLLGLAGAGVG